MTTLEEAKEFLRKNWIKGTHCPCCNQFVKRYERQITSSMAWQLILLHKHFEKNPNLAWIHAMEFFKSLPDVASALVGGDFAKLEYWDLIERKDEIRDDGSDRNGYYRLTEKGREFALCKLSVPQYAYIYNQKFLGFSEKMITIRQALKKRFNYDVLMGHNTL